MKKINRRNLIASSTITLGGALIASTAAANCDLTPKQALGPFYPEAHQDWEDNDLTGVDGSSDHGRADAMLLKGVVSVSRNGKCSVLKNARVEIWQTDDSGKYKHSGDEQQNPGARDPDFQYFGEAKTNDQGEYEFVTIVPGKYSGRTQHIHIRVVSDDRSLSLVTQLYFDRFKRNNSQDGIYVSLLKKGLAGLVTAPIQSVQGARQGDVKQECIFNLTLSGEGENNLGQLTPEL